MIDEILGGKSLGAGKKAKPKAKKRGAKKAKAAKKQKTLKKAAVKKVKKVAGKRGRKRAPRKISAKAAPSILVVGSEGKIEPVWIRYSQMTPAKRGRVPGVPTSVRVGNLVRWTTEGGKERMGVVREFCGDSAVVGLGGKNEMIRIARLTIVATKVKEM